MPMKPDGTFARNWRFTERFNPGDNLTRVALDAAFDDVLEGLDAALEAGKKIPFPDRSEFLTWAASATPLPGKVVHVRVRGQAQAISYVYDGYSTDFREPELQGWRAVPPVYLEHYGVVTTSKGDKSGADYTKQVQAAMDATEGDLIFTGFVKVTKRVICPNRCRPHCPEGRSYGGLNVFADFNKFEACVLQPGTAETAATVGDFGIWFEQPSNPTTRADLYHYPPAINIGFPGGETEVHGDPSTYTGLARGHLKAIRIENAWDGIIGIGNCGGYRMGVIEVGAVNRQMDLYGALDFVHIESFEGWPYGMNDAVADIMYDGQTIGFRARHVDGLTVDKLSVFRSKVILGKTGRSTILPMGIDVLNLDGDKAVLRLEGESTKIGDGYSSKSADLGNVNYPDLVASGGSHQIGSFKATSNADGIVTADGPAELHIEDYKARQVSGARSVAVSKNGARLTFGTTRPESDAARTGHMFVQKPGSSMHIASLAPLNSEQPDVAYVKFEEDHPLNFANCPQYTISAPPGATQGTYIGRGTSHINGPLDLMPVGAEGGELRFRNSSSEVSYFIDVDGSNNLRIRTQTEHIILVTAAGALKMPGVAEYASDTAASAGGVLLGEFYISTANGALTKRRT